MRSLKETVNRARVVEDMALAIAQHRLGDTDRMLPPESIVEQGDRTLALQLVRMAEPLYPLPTQTVF